MPSTSGEKPIPGQTEIKGDKVGMGEVDDQLCNWCDQPATKSFEIYRKMKGGRRGAVVPTGMFIFACDRHRNLGDEAVSTPRPSLR